MRGFSTRLFLRNTNKIPSENHTVAQAFGGNENVEVANQPLRVDNVQDRAQDEFYVLQVLKYNSSSHHTLAGQARPRGWIG